MAPSSTQKRKLANVVSQEIFGSCFASAFSLQAAGSKRIGEAGLTPVSPLDLSCLVATILWLNATELERAHCSFAFAAPVQIVESQPQSNRILPSEWMQKALLALLPQLVSSFCLSGALQVPGSVGRGLLGAGRAGQTDGNPAVMICSPKSAGTLSLRLLQGGEPSAVAQLSVPGHGCEAPSRLQQR